MEVALMHRQTKDIIPRKKSETILKDTFSKLSPKDRRPLNKAGARELTAFLTSSFEDFDYDAVVLLSNLAVDPKTRGQGLGTELCGEVLERAKEWGYDEVVLEVEECNEGARGLYDKVGFEQVGEAMDKGGVRVKEDGILEDREVRTIRMSRKIN